MKGKIWFLGKFEAEVHKEKLRTSPLVQGGLAIPIKISVTGDEPEKLSSLVAKVKEAEYFLTREEDEYDDNDVEFHMKTFDNEEIQML